MIKITDLLLAVLCVELGIGFAGALVTDGLGSNAMTNTTYSSLEVTNLSVGITPLIDSSLDMTKKLQNEENAYFPLNVVGFFGDFFGRFIPIIVAFGFFLVQLFPIASLVGSSSALFFATAVSVFFDVIIVLNILYFIMGKAEI